MLFIEEVCGILQKATYRGCPDSMFKKIRNYRIKRNHLINIYSVFQDNLNEWKLIGIFTLKHFRCM